MTGPATRAVFLGTPPEAVPTLRHLADQVDVVAVITNPDRARGRSDAPQPSAVKVAAGDLGIEVRQPQSHLELLVDLGETSPDVGVVVAYGRIIKPEALAVPAFGLLNVHFSLLPRWRGASPVVRAILAGDEETGVTIMKIDEGMDTGPALARAATPIGPTETAGDLTGRLAHLGAHTLADSLPAYLAGEITPQVQSVEGATAAAKVTVDEAHIDPAHSRESVERAVRAFNPRPGAWTTVEGRRFKIWEAHPTDADAAVRSIVADDDRVLLGLRAGAVELIEIQPEGKQRMGAAEWMRGRRGEAAVWGASML